MREGAPERRIARIETMADARARVSAAVQEGIQYAVLVNDLGGVNGRRLLEAAQDALARDVSTTDEEALKQIAEEAVEGVLKEIGYDTAKVLGDFYVTVDMRLGKGAMQ